jgi:hypothetical protein
MNAIDPSHPSYRELLGLLGLAMAMEFEPETAFHKYAGRYLQTHMINYLEQKFPRSDFGPTLEWANAVKGEIKSLLTQPSLIGPEHDQIVNLYHSARNFSGDLFKQELALDERLDAMIDRAVKRLIQTKAMKQMLGQTSTERSDERPTKIVANRTSKV